MSFTWDKKIEALKKLDTGESINAVVAAREAELVKMNQDQLLKGVDDTGASLEPSYAMSTQKRKKQGPRPVTLYDSGKFHRSFFINRTKQEVEFTATPNETGRGFALRDHLKKVYGKAIFGLTDINFRRLQRLCKERIIDDIRKALA